MTIDIGLRNYVLGDAGIAALVVDDADPNPVWRQRIYPIRLPQKARLPAITFQQISDVREGHLRGTAVFARARYQVDAYALMPKDAKILGGLIRQRLDAFSGTWSDVGSPADTVYVQGVFFDGAMDLFDEDISGGSSRHSADYFIVHATAAGAL